MRRRFGIVNRRMGEQENRRFVITVYGNGEDVEERKQDLIVTAQIYALIFAKKAQKPEVPRKCAKFNSQSLKGCVAPMSYLGLSNILSYNSLILVFLSALSLFT